MVRVGAGGEGGVGGGGGVEQIIEAPRTTSSIFNLTGNLL